MTRERLCELLTYNQETGDFHWIKRNQKKAGSNLDGYTKIKIDGKNYLAHRLVWLYVYGKLPLGAIDHVNHIRNDNRLDNLRDVDSVSNSRNRSLGKNNVSGIIGVFWNSEQNRWQSQIKVDGKQIYLGIFSEFHEAVNVRKNAEVLYGFHKNHGGK